VRHESQHGRARPRPDRRDGGAVAALALAGLAVAVAGLAFVLPAVRAGADGPRRGAPVVSGAVPPALVAVAAETGSAADPVPAPASAAGSPSPSPAALDPEPVTAAGTEQVTSPGTEQVTTPGASPAPGAPPTPAPAADAVPLPLGACLRADVVDVATAQADLDAGCTVELAYGPARWLAAHDHDAGDAWKAMPDGAEFSYAGHTYRVVDRTRADYVTGPVALDPLVHGDLTLQTCEGTDRLVFLHAALVG
jgi:hypothetical protein